MSNELAQPVGWKFFFRVIVKAAVLFTLCNLIFAAVRPLETLGSISLYNTILPGRERLPYGENPDQSYNLSLNNIPAMLASHVVSRPKASDEYRVFIIGDSGIWGWFLQNKDTLASRINMAGYTTPGGKRIVAYNLGYPVLALLKDLLILDAALPNQPDLIIWPITLDSFPQQKQYTPALVQNNQPRIQAINKTYLAPLFRLHPLTQPVDTISYYAASPTISDLWNQTIVSKRRDLADLLRLQLYGFSWTATGIDQYIPAEIPLRTSDFDTDISWQGISQSVPLNDDILAWDNVQAGINMAENVSVLIINEPIYISGGQNSDLRYNAWYPRWAYDEYRNLLGQKATEQGWNYLDLWDEIAPDEFTDSPVHLTPAGEQQLADKIGNQIIELLKGQS